MLSPGERQTLETNWRASRSIILSLPERVFLKTDCKTVQRGTGIDTSETEESVQRAKPDPLPPKEKKKRGI